MSFREQFKARAQFSFRAVDDSGSDRFSKINLKVAELFYDHKKAGSLRDWLMQLAYADAEKEIEAEELKASLLKASTLECKDSSENVKAGDKDD